jgi:hypothetical protein
MSVILATQEAENWKITVQSQPGQIVHETLSQKNPSQKRAGGVAQGIDPEFKLQNAKKKKKRERERPGRLHGTNHHPSAHLPDDYRYMSGPSKDHMGQRGAVPA